MEDLYGSLSILCWLILVFAPCTIDQGSLGKRSLLRSYSQARESDDFDSDLAYGVA